MMMVTGAPPRERRCAPHDEATHPGSCTTIARGVALLCCTLTWGATTDAARLEALIPHLQGALGKKPEHVVDLLKIWRTNGLSVTDVAEAVGVVRKTLRYWSMGLSAGGRDWPALRELMDAEGLQRITPALEASSASAGSSVHLQNTPRVDSHRTPRARVED